MPIEDSLLNIVKQKFTEAIKNAIPDIPNEYAEAIISLSNPKFGDYQCNNAMTLFRNKALIGGKLNECKSPKDIGEWISRTVDPNLEGELFFSEITASPQGFITTKIDNGWLERRVAELISTKDGITKWLKLKDGNCKVAVDYSSPNVAKDMHVGHLRSTIHGDAICRVLEAVGHDVTRINHYGDWGTQFGMLIQYIVDNHPDFQSNPPPLSDLCAFYKKSKLEFDTNPDFKERARKMVVSLQAGDKTAMDAWKLLVDISFQDYSKIYKRLNVSDKLIKRGESWYNDMLPDIIQKCQEKGIVEESDGALCIFVEEGEKKEDEVPLMLVKRDGGYGYDSTDMAAIYHRVVMTKHDWLVYVTDVGQEGHFLKVFKAAKKMGWIAPPERDVRTDHMGLGLVCGEDGKKFKTRSGDVVRLTELLDEAVSRAMAELKNRRAAAISGDEDAAGCDTNEGDEDLLAASEKIGYAAVKYFDLKQVRTGNYKFSFEKMLDPKGKTAVYLLYSYARLCSIFRKANRTTVDSNNVPDSADKPSIKITEPQERALCLLLLKYKDVIQTTLNTLSCHHICDFTYDLAVAFSDFYKDCKIINSPQESSRLSLCQAVQLFLNTSFQFIGIQPLSKL